MKKAIFVIIVFSSVNALNAQDISMIVDNYEKSVGVEKLSSFKTIKITGTMTQMNMTMPILMLEKNPDKIKIVSTINNSELVQVVNGNRGYMINPMMGSTDPIELQAEQIDQIKGNRMLRSSLRDQLGNGRLELVGDETINGRASFKIKSITDAGDVFMLIDKETYYVLATQMTVNQMGMEMSVEMRMSDFTDLQGVIMPMKIETYMGGQFSGSIEYKSIEFDIPIDDSEFAIK
ncbi:MAG TPA: hypothetical protein VMW76_04860 [Bacteroidales bacterium]|nr:hypothetical protein [Bacteroidales bacterium]